MEEKEVILTQEGHDNLEKELNYLKTEKQSLSETIHLQVRQEEKRLSAMGNWFITKSAVVKHWEVLPKNTKSA